MHKNNIKIAKFLILTIIILSMGLGCGQKKESPVHLYKEAEALQKEAEEYYQKRDYNNALQKYHLAIEKAKESAKSDWNLPNFLIEECEKSIALVKKKAEDEGFVYYDGCYMKLAEKERILKEKEEKEEQERRAKEEERILEEKKQKQELSEISLSLEDIASKYFSGQSDQFVLDSERFICGPEEAAKEFEPHSVSTWKNWGFELACERHFKRTPGGLYTESIFSYVFRFSNTVGAKSVLEDTYKNISDKLLPSQLLVPIKPGETIGEQTFVISWMKTDFNPELHGVYFRKKNTYVYIISHNLQDALANTVSYARIVANKIK